MHILVALYKIFVLTGGRAGSTNRAGVWEIGQESFADKRLQNNSVLKYIYFFKTFTKFIWSTSKSIMCLILFKLRTTFKKKSFF